MSEDTSSISPSATTDYSDDHVKEENISSDISPMDTSNFSRKKRTIIDEDSDEDTDYTSKDIVDPNAQEGLNFNSVDDFDDMPKRPTKKQKVIKKTAPKKREPKKTVTKLKQGHAGNDTSAGKQSVTKIKDDPLKKKVAEEDENVYKWWAEDEKDEKLNPLWKWKTLEHNGVYFPPEYVPHGVKMKYNDVEIDLTPEQEEIATFFAKYMTTDHYEKPQFRKNFFKDFLKILNKGMKKGQKHVIQKLEKCDFTPIQVHLAIEKEKRANRTKEEKNLEKLEKQKNKEKYGYAIVDGRKEPIGNYTIEPPGLFLGRGNHPKAGKLKARVIPEQITLNISEGAKIPECPPGHTWGKIIHNREVSWIASWTENISNTNKYVLFGPASSIRGQSDRSKFEVARKLKHEIARIRESYEKELLSDDMLMKQRATALWVIDNLALRVGNEKKQDEADTVGCCTLRVEHIEMKPPNTVVFDFLGKDSMRYYNEVQVIEQVYKNLKLFKRGKKPEQPLFDRLSPPSLNKHLQSFMDGLTAKVFRTYNASITLKNELEKYMDKDLSTEEKVLFFNRANREVAILCNHQRTVAKNFSSQMGRIDEKIDVLNKEIEFLKQVLDGKVVESPLVKKKKRSRKEDGEDSEEEEEVPLYKIPKSEEKILKRIETLEARIKKEEVKKVEKEDLKQVALNTSKSNYIDPRIAFAWCKKIDLDEKKVFSKLLRMKFPWALEEAGDDFDW